MSIVLGLPDRKISILFIFRVVFPVLLLCLIFDLVSGFFFGSYFNKLATQYPAILIMIPALMGLRGNVFGALGSRISTKLYLGEISPSVGDKFVRRNIIYSLYLSFAPTLLIWALACFKFLRLEVVALKIVLFSCIITSTLLGLITVFLVILSFKRCIDPDSILGPGITTAADLITLPTIISVILLFERYPTIFNYLLAIFIIILLAISLKLPKKELTNDLKIIRESLTVLCFLPIIQSVAGNILESHSEFIAGTIFLAYAYPPVLDSVGNFGSISSARISTKLHLGEITKISLKEIKEELKLLILAPFIAVVILVNSLLLQKLHFQSPVVVGKQLLLTILLFIGTFICLVFSIILISLVICVILHKKNIDPDNGAIPLITAIGDLLGTCLIIVLAILL